jgi:hypothetical protein
MKLQLTPEEQALTLAEAAKSMVDQAKSFTVQRYFLEFFGGNPPPTDLFGSEVAATLLGLETVGFDLNRRASIGDPATAEIRPWESLLWPAFRIRRATLPEEDGKPPDSDRLDAVYRETLDGIVSNRLPELKYQLRRMDIRPDGAGLGWDSRLQSELRKALLLLVRKDGVGDLTTAGRVVADLRISQKEGEAAVLGIDSPSLKHLAASRALAFYYVARAIELTTQLLSGSQVRIQHRTISVQGIKTENDRLLSAARDIVKGNDPELVQELPKLNQALNALVDASVHAIRLPPSVRPFIDGLASRRDKPIFEFWWGQRQALDSRLLDATRSAIVASMPTSAGKTLLAEMAIVQSAVEEHGKKVIYLAPTRALVTQVTLTLRRDFVSSGLVVQSATSGFDLDPIERAVLDAPYDVLVTTPEKLDLLVRTNHNAVQDISLVVVDEAHNIGEGLRGARLELLLSTLRRERAGCRFLLLTPFAQNAADVARWLGGNSGVPILVDWKPNDLVVGAFRAGKKSRGSRPLTYSTLDSVHSDCPGGLEIDIGYSQELDSITKEKLSVVATANLARSIGGGILLLAQSRRDAEQRAMAVAQMLDLTVEEADVDLVARYIFSETGGDHPLPGLLKRGVAFHHAGLSPESRYFIERLVERGRIRVICATTTLAQGVHFPLSTAVIESLNRREKVLNSWRVKQIAPQEFWNVIGRVGRTFEDSLGSVCFIARDDGDIEVAQKFLENDARTVQSAIAQMMGDIANRPPSFSLGMVERYLPLSALLQYILHAIAVGNEGDLTSDALDSLIRNSFAFLRAEQRGEDVSKRLLEWSKAYVDYVKSQKGQTLKAYVAVADDTGFSSPSVDRILAEWRGVTKTKEWVPEALFPESGDASPILARAMATLGKIPEVRLGSYEEPEFSPQRVARIVTLWVNGTTISEIARQEYGGDVIDCTRHLYSAITGLVPWGLRAIERVGFAGQESVDWDALELIQAMVLHGVRSPHAIGLRLLGVPRFAAERLGHFASGANVEITKLRGWVNSIEPQVWQEALGAGSRISGAECQRLWKVIDGQLAWDDLVG